MPDTGSQPVPLRIRRLEMLLTSLFRSRVIFNIFEGAPGVATFYSLDVSTWSTNMDALWDAIWANAPGGATATVEHFGDEIEDTTGALVGAWDDHTSDHVVTGGGIGPYAPPVGALVQWRTGVILDGSRVQGHTFVVPMSGNSYDASGFIASTFRTPMQSAADAFVAAESSSFVIWHRPFPGRAAGPGTPPKPTAKAAHDGGHALVTSAVVPGKTAVLRSRRD